MLDLGGVGKKCLKCGHVRSATDAGPDYACPQCGVVYAKAEAAQRAREAARIDVETRAQETAAQQAWEAENLKELHANRAEETHLSTTAHLVYILFLLPVGLTAIIGVIIAHVMRGKAHGTWVASHFSWQIDTFWKALVWSIALLIAMVLLYVVAAIAFPVKGVTAGVTAIFAVTVAAGTLGLAISVWCLYRVIKGWINLFQTQEVTA